MDMSIELMQKIKGADDLSRAVEVMQPVLQLRAIVRIARKAVARGSRLAFSSAPQNFFDGDPREVFSRSRLRGRDGAAQGA